MKDWKQYCEAQSLREQEGMEPPPQQMGQPEPTNFDFLDRGDSNQPWHQRGDENFLNARGFLVQAKNKLDGLLQSLDQNALDPADEEKEAGIYDALEAIAQDFEQFKYHIG